MKKYIKVMFDNKGANYEYKIDKVNIANTWNPDAKSGKDFGGFNFSNEENILRWLHRGDTLYDVIIPEDAEVIEIVECATPHGVFRSNKIIVTNPRKVTDDMAMYFYEKSNIPEFSYFKALAAVSVMNYRETAFKILREKINSENIDTALDEWNNFIHRDDREGKNPLVEEIEDILLEIKNPLDISLCVSKRPYEKILTDDNIINLTGQSGSGKSYYAKENFNTDDYVIIDTDEIFSEKGFDSATGLNKELGIMFRNKYETLPTLSEDFDLIYNNIIDYCKDMNKTIVIDCAQFHCIKDIKNLKGKIIIIRTDIDTCYNRTINRWIESHKINNIDYTSAELEAYKERKKAIYKWYKGTNKFISDIDSL